MSFTENIIYRGGGVALSASDPTTITPDDAAAAGSSLDAAPADHTHAIACAAPSNTGIANSEGVATSFARSDHVHNTVVTQGQTILAGASNASGILYLAGGGLMSSSGLSFNASYGAMAIGGSANTTATLRIVRSTSGSTSEERQLFIEAVTHTTTTVLTNQRFNMISQPTISSTAGQTITNAATLYIEGAPAAAGASPPTITNNWALWVDAGNVKFDGNLTVDGTLTVAGSAVSSAGVQKVSTQTIAGSPGTTLSFTSLTGDADSYYTIKGTIIAASDGMTVKLKFNTADGDQAIGNANTGAAVNTFNDGSAATFCKFMDDATAAFFTIEISASRTVEGATRDIQWTATLTIVSSVTAAPQTIFCGGTYTAAGELTQIDIIGDANLAVGSTATLFKWPR